LRDGRDPERSEQLDPLTDDYPELTPYQYASCDPITNIDLDGLEGVKGVKEMTAVVVTPSIEQLSRLLKNVVVATKITAHLALISARGVADALANSNSMGIWGIWNDNNVEEYSDPIEKEIYLWGKIQGSGFGIAQGFTEMSVGDNMIGGGLATAAVGGSGLVVSAGGALVALHGAIGGAIASAQLVKSVQQLWHIYRVYSVSSNSPGQHASNSSSNGGNNSGANDPPPMLGRNGTQTRSITVKKLTPSGSRRIDVENPAPGKRPGQVHYQDNDEDIKYLFDPKSKQFLNKKGTPISVSDNKKLLDNVNVQDGINKALKYLGEPTITF
jgi:hypothetical protein